MKRKEVVLINSFIFILILGFGLMAINLSLNHTAANQTAAVQNKKPQTNAAACSPAQPLNIQVAGDPGLKRLQDYQNLCQSFVTNKLMVFTGFSQDKGAAEDDAKKMATKLERNDKAGR